MCMSKLPSGMRRAMGAAHVADTTVAARRCMAAMLPSRFQGQRQAEGKQRPDDTPPTHDEIYRTGIGHPIRSEHREL